MLKPTLSLTKPRWINSLSVARKNEPEYGRTACPPTYMSIGALTPGGTKKFIIAYLETAEELDFGHFCAAILEFEDLHKIELSKTERLSELMAEYAQEYDED